jgi:mono/diheme cytochrome c family protein
MLFHVVKNGSPGEQGTMLAWGEKLSDDDMIAAIAWFQSKWPDQIYAAWMQREMASRSEKKG